MDTIQRNKLLVKIMQNNNLSFSYDYKKSEKLTAAVHIVTGSINVQEPICRLLRDKALSAFSKIIALGTVGKKGTIDVDKTRSSIVEVVSILGVAHRSGYISETNYSLLEGEYLDLGVFIEKNAERLTQEKTLSHESLSVPYTETITKIPSAIYKGQLKTEKRQEEGHISKINEVKHEERRETIMALLRENGKITVKDISHIVTNCSEKTLQRELSSMVKNGILKKEGERRWSQYSLVL